MQEDLSVACSNVAATGTDGGGEQTPCVTSPPPLPGSQTRFSLSLKQQP